MAHRHVGAATSLCHIPLRPSLYCISLPYPSAASCGCSKARLSAGSWGHGPCPQRLTGCLPHASLCGLRVAVALAASWKARSRHESQAPAAGRAPHQLAQPSRKPRTLQSARPLFTIGPTLVLCSLAAQASASLADLRHAPAAWLCHTLPRRSTATVLATRRAPSATLPSIFYANPAWAQAGHSGAKPPPLHTSGKHIGLCRLITSPQRQRQAASGSPMPPVRNKLLVRHAQHNRMQASQSALPT